jgi:hypothetical protein
VSYMTYSLTLELNIYKTDSNKILGVNKFAKHAIFSKVKSEIAKLSLGKRPEKPLTSFQITAIRHASRFLDYDNLVASLKPVLDGLKLAKVIEDDNWNFVKRDNYFPDQIKSTQRKIVITVEETNANSSSILDIHQKEKKRKTTKGKRTS